MWLLQEVKAQAAQILSGRPTNELKPIIKAEKQVADK